MREMSVSEKIAMGVVGGVLVLLFLAGGVYVYGRYINEDWGRDQLYRLAEWRFQYQARQVCAALEQANHVTINREERIANNGGCESTILEHSIVNYVSLADMPGIHDISPLAGIPLQYIDLSNTRVTDLSPLVNTTDLYGLVCAGTPIIDFTPLAKMHLGLLDLSNTAIHDLSILKGMSLSNLKLSNTMVTDFSLLAEMKDLSDLDCSGTAITDLTPLTKLPLSSLNLSGTPVSDITALKGMQLCDLDLSNTQVADLSPLEGANIENLKIDGTPAERARKAAAASSSAAPQK